MRLERFFTGIMLVFAFCELKCLAEVGVCLRGALEIALPLAA